MQIHTRLEQCGRAEKRTIEEATRAMQTSTNGGVSAHELYFGKKPNLGHLRMFGSIAYVHVPKENQRKLDAKAEKYILVSYSDE